MSDVEPCEDEGIYINTAGDLYLYTDVWVVIEDHKGARHKQRVEGWIPLNKVEDADGGWQRGLFHHSIKRKHGASLTHKVFNLTDVGDTLLKKIYERKPHLHPEK